MSTGLIGEILAVAPVPGAIFGVLIGFPVAFTLAGVSLLFAWLGWLLGHFDSIFLPACRPATSA